MLLSKPWMRSLTSNDMNTGSWQGPAGRHTLSFSRATQGGQENNTALSTRLLWHEFNCWFENMCLFYYSFKFLSIISMLSEKRVKEEGLSRTLDVGSLMLKYNGGGHKKVGTCQCTDENMEKDLPKMWKELTEMANS